jgi:hypothetical protein
MARTRKAAEEGPFTNQRAAKALKARWGEGGPKGTPLRADWNSVDPVVVHSLICAVGALGGACTIGVDKNGAGFTITVWCGGEKLLNRWFRGDQDGINALHVEVEDFTADVQTSLRAQ